MLVDTTEYLAEPLGPAATAHLRVCRADEPVLWAAYARAHYYDIPGLDEKGKPKQNVLLRGVGGVLGTVVDAAIGSEQGPDKPPPADVIVFGPAPDCLAHRYLPPELPRRRLWTLTPHRLAPHNEIPAPEPEPAGSFLGRAAKFGRGIAKIGGLSEYDVRRPLTVTGTNLLGLVKHVASVEARYFGEVFDRPSPEPLPRVAGPRRQRSVGG